MSPSSQIYVNSHSTTTHQAYRLRNAGNTHGYLLPHIKPGMHILDIGCGPGTISVDLAAHVAGGGGTLTALDYTSEPVERTLAHARERNVTNIKGVVGDVHDLSAQFKNDTFDIVCCSQVLQHLRDPITALREMRRVAKSNGGIVAAVESAGYTHHPDLPGIAKFWETIAELGRRRGANPHPGSRIHVWAHQAGFERESITKTTGSWCYSTDNARKGWGESAMGRITDVKEGEKSTFDQAVEVGVCTPDDLDTMIQDWKEWLMDPDSWGAIWNAEILCRK